MKLPRNFFKPLAVGAPAPVLVADEDQVLALGEASQTVEVSEELVGSVDEMNDHASPARPGKRKPYRKMVHSSPVRNAENLLPANVHAGPGADPVLPAGMQRPTKVWAQRGMMRDSELSARPVKA